PNVRVCDPVHRRLVRRRENIGSQLAGRGEPTMMVDYDLGRRLSAVPKEPRPFVGRYRSDEATGKDQQLQPDRLVSTFQLDQPTYLNALRIEFKRRVRDQSAR